MGILDDLFALPNQGTTRPQAADLPAQAPSFWDKLGQTWPARMAKDAYSAAMLPGDVYQGNVSMYGDDGRTNPAIINRAADLGGLVMGGGFGGTGPGGVAIGSGPIRRAAVDSPTMGLSQNEINDLAVGQVSRVKDLMASYGYNLESQKNSPLSEALYLLFRTENPPAMSKSGTAQLFKEMKDSGVSLANNPTGDTFNVRIANHKSGSGGYPSPQYEWALSRKGDYHENQLSILMEAMQRIAKERPMGGLENSNVQGNALGAIVGKSGGRQ